MSYIKELYKANPELLVEFVKKVFKTKYDNHIKVSLMRELNKNLEDEVLLYIQSSMYNNVDTEALTLKDFSIVWKGENLKFDDKRLMAYLKFMTKIYGKGHVLKFGQCRNYEKMDWLNNFDTVTISTEKEMLAVLDKPKKKTTKQNKDTYSL